MGFGDGKFLHYWRLHPFAAGDCSGSSVDQSNSGTKTIAKLQPQVKNLQVNKYNYEQHNMGTRVSITLFSDKPEKEFIENVQFAFHVFEKLENQFSVFKDSSEISQINSHAGQSIPASPLMLDTILYALEVAKETQGVFNPLIGALTIPYTHDGPMSIDAYRQIQIDRQKQTVVIPASTSLDLNSLVKGMAIDQALDCLRHVENVIIEAGGDIKVKGLPPEQNVWKIGIRDPQLPTKLLTIVPLKDAAICTSGGYFRKLKAVEGHRYHLVNPLNHQTENAANSVSVIAPTAETADALSTAAFFMPLETAISFVESHDNCSCLIIDRQNQIFMSPRMKALFTLI
jgi:thiamine biosynthesis lipoprotein